MISGKAKDLFGEARKEVDGMEKTESREDSYTTGFWFWKKTHYYTVNVTTVRAGAMKSVINNLVTDLEENMISSVESAKKDWKQNVQKRITRALMEAVGDDVDLINVDMLKTALRRMVGNMELPAIDVASHGFANAQTGNLEGSEAERFLSEAQSYQGELRNYYTKQTSAFISALEKSAKKEKMSGLILGDIKTQLETLEKELSNKNLTLDRLNKCKTALDTVS
jgi:hypothetical protein